MVLQGNRKVWALGPGVALGLIDLCGAQYSPTGGQATHTVDLTLQENKTFPIFSYIFQYFLTWSSVQVWNSLASFMDFRVSQLRSVSLKAKVELKTFLEIIDVLMSA